MAGKSYTMREMKNIVQYLVEHRSYGEVKGKKMWMDFASSKLTNRTWQSLKTCFLQRILPDIHNPYYKLTREQILSFRERQDMEKSINNKLDIQTISEDSSENQEGKEQRPSTSKNKETAVPGENPKCSKISSRISTSTETLVLDNCPEEPMVNGEDRQKQSSIELVTHVEVHSSAVKKDEIPQTIAANVQVIIDDFQTESDDSHNINKKLAEDAEDLQTSKDADNQAVVSVKSLRLRKKEKSEKVQSPKKSPKKSSTPDIEKENAITDLPPTVPKEVTTQKSFNSTDDTQLPNNQEHLAAKANKVDLNRTSIEKSTNKRAPSEEINNCEPLNKKPILKKNNPKNKAVSESGNKNESTLAERIAKNVDSEIINVASDYTDPIVKPGNTLTNTTVESIINPCLNSVNLYAEQFSQSRCIDSDLEEIENVDTKKDRNKHVDIVKEVVMLKSHSDSSVEERPVQRSREITKREQRTLANLFGFSNGGDRKSRNRQDKSHSRQFTHHSSNSSDWTSESEDEYVSPPRGRRNRHSRKVLKPHSARILSLEEEGGLFVMYNKKIYPLVKDGKRIKKYLTYMQESDDEQESYWKLKYVEERKKADRLSRLINKADKNGPEIREISSSPTLKPARRPTSNQQSSLKNDDTTGKDIVLLDNQTSNLQRQMNGAAGNSKPEQHLKLKFTKNNEELQLEGNWSNIHPVLEQVMHIFHKEDPKENGIEFKVEKEPASRQSTPVVGINVDEETRRKVDKLEEAIFNDISQKENLEKMNSSKDSGSKESNVTRRGRKKKIPSTTSLASPSKKLRGSAAEADGSTSKESMEIGRRTLRDVSRKRNSYSRADKSNTKMLPEKSENVPTSSQVEEDSDIRYMFPPNVTNQSDNNSKDSKHKKNLSRAARMLSISLNSTGNISGTYRDSDQSPVHVYPKRKKKLSVSTVIYREKYKNQRKNRRRSFPQIVDDASNESSRSMPFLPAKSKIVLQNSTLNSDVYKSESFQILMPKSNKVQRTLDNIDEICSPEKQDSNIEDELRGNICIRDDIRRKKRDNTLSPYSAESNHFGNSSNVSLPVSPEISIVENLSVNKTMLSRASIADFTMLNELQGNNDKLQTTHGKKYTMSAVDVTVPLMEQDCGMQLRSQKSDSGSVVDKMSIDANTLLDKTGTVNMENIMSSSADSLDERLRDLLLESAKKMTQHINEQKEKENISLVPDVVMASANKKDKTKRCSTPRKRNRKTKATTRGNINAIIEEERTEACSHGRKSCPPVIHVAQSETAMGNDVGTSDKPKPKAVRGRKKKDVIKVKILKPKPVKSNTSIRKTLSGSKLSIPDDSGIHDTVSVLMSTEDSIDLIHNHSETCLYANECIGDSLEIVESAKSIISVNSSTSDDRSFEELIKNMPPDSYSNNAQHAVTYSFDAINQPPTRSNLEEFESEAVFYTLASADSFNSIMTEDLSDEIQRPPNWYLFSENENTKSNNANCNQKSVGASLNTIFPITCAVPDLSTITEASREGDSRKPTLNEDGDLKK